MPFNPKTRGRAWVVTVQITNMQNLGLTEEQYNSPEKLADFLIKHWENSGKDRSAAVAVCVSEHGLYHAHLALYGNSTTLKRVAELFGNSHVQPQLGGKKQLTDYLVKEKIHADKKEQVLCTKNLDVIQDAQGNRSDLKQIELLINQGNTPEQIFEMSFSFRRYEKMIKQAYLSKRIKDMGVTKEMHNEYHFGESGTGKTNTYIKLCEKYGRGNIYLCTDYSNNGTGAFDRYNDNPCDIVFLDEYRGEFNYNTFLTILDKYPDYQLHCRYQNTLCLWTSVYICSILTPEQVYYNMVGSDNYKSDNIKQFLRRLDKIVYHYVENGEYKTFELPATEYTNADDMLRRIGKNTMQNSPSISQPLSSQSFFKALNEYKPNP